MATKNYAADHKFRKTCNVEGHGESRFGVIKTGKLRSRVLPLGTAGEGFVIENSKLSNVQEEKPAPKAAAETVAAPATAAAPAPAPAQAPAAQAPEAPVAPEAPAAPAAQEAVAATA